MLLAYHGKCSTCVYKLFFFLKKANFCFLKNRKLSIIKRKVQAFFCQPSPSLKHHLEIVSHIPFYHWSYATKTSSSAYSPPSLYRTHILRRKKKKSITAISLSFFHHSISLPSYRLKFFSLLPISFTISTNAVICLYVCS